VKYLHLLLRNLGRRKVRTVFTFLAVVAAFFLFGFLMAVKNGFDAGIQIAGQKRLLTIHKVSIILQLPLRHLEQIRRVPGVAKATPNCWFGGVYVDKKNFFAQIAVEPEDYLEIYPEFVLPPEQKQAFLSTRTGAIAGAKLARRFGWEVGDKIPIEPTFWRPRDGGPTTYTFDLVGIYEGASRDVDETQFYFRYDYLMERMGDIGIAGWYVVEIEDPEHADRVAMAIDEQFANSSAETKTTTEKAFMKGFAEQIGDTGAILMAIVAVVFFIILLIAANTMAQSVRERTAELGVLKTLGFTDGAVLGLVLAESLLLVLVAAAVGLALTWLAVPGLRPLVEVFLPVFWVPPRTLALGALVAVLLGIAAGGVPAWLAMRLRIVEALGRR
jgi:putative ABC transport system permease protein